MLSNRDLKGINCKGEGDWKCTIFLDGFIFEKKKKADRKRFVVVEGGINQSNSKIDKELLKISRSKFIVLASTSPLYTDQNQVKKKKKKGLR